MATSVLHRKYGWKPDTPDERDHILKFSRAQLEPKKLPLSVDLRPYCPPVYDQGSLGSCTGNAIAGAIQYCLNRQIDTVPDIMPSRLFIYYNERELEGTVNEDAGAMIRDGIKVVNRYGVCSESIWPYDISKFTVKPPQVCYMDALKDRVVEYSRVPQNLTSFRACLAEGFPIVFGISIFTSFESEVVARTGVVSMPSQNEECLGGHAILCVGYQDAQKRFIVRNSWGSGWGDQGYFTLPYSYMTSPQLANDFWAIKLIGVDASVKVAAPPVPEVKASPEVKTKKEVPTVVEKKQDAEGKAGTSDASLKLDVQE